MPLAASACALPETATNSAAVAPTDASLRVVVLASGEGSNLQALMDAIAVGALQARIVAVCSDRPGCRALARAAAAGIPTWARAPREFASRAAFDESLFSAIADVQPGLIVCAGYLRLISPLAVADYAGRMINIHPSLLPAYPGLHTHARALAEGAAEHGASVHFVSAVLDGGALIAQVRVPVRADDDADTLAARVLVREHPLLVQSVRLIAEHRVQLRDATVWLDQWPLPHPLRLQADDTLTLQGSPLDA